MHRETWTLANCTHVRATYLCTTVFGIIGPCDMSVTCWLLFLLFPLFLSIRYTFLECCLCAVRDCCVKYTHTHTAQRKTRKYYLKEIDRLSGVTGDSNVLVDGISCVQIPATNKNVLFFVVVSQPSRKQNKTKRERKREHE